MALLDKLKQIFTQTPVTPDSWTTAQQEALLDLLLLGVYVDKKVSLEEAKFLENHIQELTENTGIDWDAYAAAALQRIHKFEDDPNLRHQFVLDIRGRLADEEKWRIAVNGLKALLEVDGYVPVEQTFFDEVNALFQ